MGLIYEIEHPEVQKHEFGELNKPFLYHISSGQRNGKSLILHHKIGDKCHQMIIAKVNKASVNLKCKFAGCKATHKIKIEPQYVLVEENGMKRGPASEKGPSRKKFYLDYSDKKLRDISIWTMMEHNSEPHKNEENFGFFDSVSYDLREAHTELALHTGSIEFKTVARTFGLQQIYGPEVYGDIVKSTRNEVKSASSKIKRKFLQNADNENVPDYAKTIAESNFNDSNLAKNNIDFHQKSTPNQIIFYLEKKLHMFSNFESLY